mmetsp:Transcript_32017/g.48997  ORF Transcript_32017/g.48997 Transcript_32017/m.48997 type:complete len:275 (-) Transcript_32017:601-1425(-)|eukprot:CAMPEP_0170488946 /NCGR_PEP_ID=MMETSP0208-20121228/7379_1 /TAXON_ID=197538 /ORGANISM="Strombidium inclinatum, Strain S3" /LENGTH=274 /DNA_ID=CAMNT_0010763669 /DNA_START=1121 /DNA_END=1945 /DNA_ORIENTATION=+
MDQVDKDKFEENVIYLLKKPGSCRLLKDSDKIVSVAKAFGYPTTVHIELRFKEGVMEQNTYLGISNDNLMLLEFILDITSISKQKPGFWDKIVLLLSGNNSKHRKSLKNSDPSSFQLSENELKEAKKEIMKVLPLKDVDYARLGWMKNMKEVGYLQFFCKLYSNHINNKSIVQFYGFLKYKLAKREIEEVHSILSCFLVSLKKLPADRRIVNQPLYRGVDYFKVKDDFEKTLSLNSLVMFTSFMSTSYRKEIAASFSQTNAADHYMYGECEKID